MILRWTHIQKGKPQIKRKLTHPLREDGQTDLGDRGYTIKHADLIGKESYTEIVNTSRDGLRHLRIVAEHPTLDEFTTLAPRRVAPIYASYASTIVSLLDIHPEPHTSQSVPRTSSPSLQILEAGTGHGSLTLQLARSIAAANDLTKDTNIRPAPLAKTLYKAGEEYEGDIEFEYSEEMETWRKERRAVLHTVDIDPQNRVHADRLIRSFRGALYWPHINFYAGDVKDWVAQHLGGSGGKPFLDIVVLDMPGVEDYIASVTPVLKPGGQLLVFQPQITQIAACVQEIAANNLGLEMNTVMELGDGISNGRQWDVRLTQLKSVAREKTAELVKSRSKAKLKSRTDSVVTEQAATDEDERLKIEHDGKEQEQGRGSTGNRIPPMVCRPLVGELTRGGGFIGLWRKSARAGTETSKEDHMAE